MFALAVLVGPEGDVSRHLRVLAHFGRHVDVVDFEGAWSEARTPNQIKEVLVREDRFHILRLAPETPSAQLIGRKLLGAELPRGVIIALLQRKEGPVFVPGATDEFHAGDRVTAIGDPDAIRALRERFDPRSA